MTCTNCGKKITDAHPFMVIISDEGTFCDIACENMNDMEDDN